MPWGLQASHLQQGSFRARSRCRDGVPPVTTPASAADCMLLRGGGPFAELLTLDSLSPNAQVGVCCLPCFPSLWPAGPCLHLSTARSVSFPSLRKAFFFYFYYYCCCYCYLNTKVIILEKAGKLKEQEKQHSSTQGAPQAAPRHMAFPVFLIPHVRFPA